MGKKLVKARLLTLIAGNLFAATKKPKPAKRTIPQEKTVYVTFNNSGCGEKYVREKYMTKSVREDEALALLEESRLRDETERMKHPERFY